LFARHFISGEYNGVDDLLQCSIGLIFLFGPLGFCSLFLLFVRKRLRALQLRSRSFLVMPL
jgi:hypothetical protein